jgi:hypothetical protein
LFRELQPYLASSTERSLLLLLGDELGVVLHGAAVWARQSLVVGERLEVVGVYSEHALASRALPPDMTRVISGHRYLDRDRGSGLTNDIGTVGHPVSDQCRHLELAFSSIDLVEETAVMLSASMPS